MLDITIPNAQQLQLVHLVLDYNGTLACDGRLLPDVRPRLTELARHLTLHVLTADTFGSVKTELQDVPCTLTIVPAEQQATFKLRYVEELHCTKTVCIGNGRNDRDMLKAAALGIAVIQTEGASMETLLAADVVTMTIIDALDLLLHPLRLVATLRA